MSMENIRGFNRTIACTPYGSRAPETTSVGKGDVRFNVLTSRAKLVPLFVVYGCEEHDIEKGDLVYLQHNEAAALKPFEVDLLQGNAKDVVLVSLDLVKLVERPRDTGEDSQYLARHK
jgi:hypothetical protein